MSNPAIIDALDKGDDDEIIGVELSDEENNEDSKNGNTNAIFELLQQMISPIKTLLEKEVMESIQN